MHVLATFLTYHLPMTSRGGTTAYPAAVRRGEFSPGKRASRAALPLWDAPLRRGALPSAAKKTPAEQQSSYAHVWFRLIGFSNNSTHGLLPTRTTNQAGRGPARRSRPCAARRTTAPRHKGFHSTELVPHNAIGVGVSGLFYVL